MADNQNNDTGATTGEDSHDLKALLSTPARDFLVRNTGEQVKIDSLKGKKLGLYFSASWSGISQYVTPSLVDLYNELSPKGQFDIIFVSSDQYEALFHAYFSRMPWLAIPFSDEETRDRLDKLFEVRDIPHIVIIDENGRVLNEDAVDMITNYGAEAFPFTKERMNQIDEEDERARREQTLRSVLVTDSRDFVISSDGNKVPVSELEGKTVALFFSYDSYTPCAPFAPELIEVYEKLKEQGENFEVVLIPLGVSEEDFEAMPWYSLPFNDKSCLKLFRHFQVSGYPTVVVLGPDGKTLNLNVVEAIKDYGGLAYPFTPEKFAELENARAKAQPLQPILVYGDQNYVFLKDGTKVPVSDFVGKNIWNASTTESGKKQGRRSKL